MLIRFQINFFHFNPMKNLGKPPLKKKEQGQFRRFPRHKVDIYEWKIRESLTEEYVREIDHARV